MAKDRTPKLGDTPVFSSNESFYFRDRFVGAGDTVLHGDPILKTHGHLFRAFAPTHSAQPEPVPEIVVVSEPDAEPEPVEAERAADAAGGA